MSAPIDTPASGTRPGDSSQRHGSVGEMKDPLVRFGVAIEESLLRQLDALAEERRCTRSELFRDLARAEVGKAQVTKGVEAAVGTLTLVYDHHVRDLSERLTELQHQLGDGVRSSMHVHLSHDLCLEVIVMQGRSDQMQALADRILAMRGVKQGGIDIIAGLPRDQGHTHSHPHSHPHSHAVSGVIEVETEPSTASGRAQRGRPGSPARTGKPESRGSRPRRGRNRRA